MKYHIRIIVSVLILFILHSGAKAQIEIKEELAERLERKKNFVDILHTVHSFYDKKSKQLKPGDTSTLKYIKRQLKFWNRWEWYNLARLDDSGNIVNVNRRNWEQNIQFKNKGQNVQTINSSYGSWTPIGPTSFTRIGSGHGGGLGRVNCVAFHPTDPNTFYIGTASGGVWKTISGGAGWIPVSDHVPSVGISGIVVSHNNPNTIYILTGDGDVSIFSNAVGVWRASVGVLKSTDGGLNWTHTGTFPSTTGDYWGFKLLQDPTNADILFAATSDGIYKTDNGGNTWTRKATGKYTDIEFNPSNHNIMYASRMSDNGSAMPNAFERSINNGDNWSSAGITGLPVSSVRLAIGVSPNSSGIVYLLAGPSTGFGSFRGLYISTDEGLNFRTKAQTPNILGGDTFGSDNRDQAWYDLGIAVNPANALHVITGGIDVWSSSDSGSTFVNRTSWVQDVTPASKYVHADIHNLTYNLLNNKLYTCSDGGISSSNDNGISWTNLWNGLQIMEYYHLTGFAGDANKLIGGSQDNGTNYRKNNSGNFFHIEGADGYSAIIDYADTSILYFSGNEVMAKSTDGGFSLDGTFVSPGNDNSWPMIAMHPTNHNIIYVGKRQAVYRNSAGGSAAWANKGVGGNMALLTCPSNSTRLYACSGPDVNIKLLGITQTFRSDDSGDSWDTLTTRPGYPNPTTLPVTDIAVSPVNSNLVWITVGGYTSGSKVYYSGNAGDNWTNISGTLPNVPTTAIVIDNNSNAYVGTDAGVFYRDWAMSDWVPFYNGLPRSPISDLVINENSQLIRAAVYGRGVFESSLYTTCIPNLLLTGGVTGNRYYEASDWINSTQIATGGEGTEIYYRAGDSVTFKNGFEIKEGNFFKAYISPCASGVPTQSRLYNEYQVDSASEIIKSGLVRISEIPGNIDNVITIAPTTGTDKEINITLKEKMFVQLYFMDETNEILAWLIKENLSPGQYKMQINDDKLKKGKVKLNIHLGGNTQSISIQ